MREPRRFAALTLLVMILISIAPVSALFFSQGHSQENTAEKFVELADSAGQQVGDLIALVYANETALELVEDAGLLDDLEGNVTLHQKGAANVTNAYAALAVGDYEGATANASEAFRIFRQVLRSLHVILCNAGLQKGQLVDAQGLLEAMRRSIQKLEKLRGILPESAAEAMELLNQAEASLDIDSATDLLLAGDINGVVYNLTQANQLIAQVHQYLKEQAQITNTFRIGNYLEICERHRDQLREKFRFAANEGINVTGALTSLGYQNESEFMQALEHLIQNAQDKIADLANAIQDLEALGQAIRDMEQALTQVMSRHQERFRYGQSGNSESNSDGSGGYGQGSNGGSDSGGGSNP